MFLHGGCFGLVSQCRWLVCYSLVTKALDETRSVRNKDCCPKWPPQDGPSPSAYEAGWVPKGLREKIPKTAQAECEVMLPTFYKFPLQIWNLVSLPGL